MMQLHIWGNMKVETLQVWHDEKEKQKEGETQTVNRIMLIIEQKVYRQSGLKGETKVIKFAQLSIS